jgi:hypothetical protein
MKPSMAKPASSRKVVDESAEVRCVAGRGLIREEVWQSESGEVVRYNLAFICHQLCALDHGRVLGYDNQHDHHHRHDMGHTEPFQYEGYDLLLTRFLTEVEVLRKGTG